MQRFFFHIDHGEPQRDTEGTELPGLAAARAEAVRLVGRLLEDAGDSFWAMPSINLTVTDGSGLALWSIDVAGTPAAVMRPKRL